ncbi:MAG: helix-turn-helix transcriptional regulator [Methylocystaceae bacterium]
MRLDRLLAIVVLLVNRRTVRARELAEMFEVSERTILRDISAINQAGIPIITYPGPRGGIGLAENYRLEQNLLAMEDIVAVLGALNGLQSAFKDNDLALTIEKVRALIPQARTNEYEDKASQMVIDLTPWGEKGEQNEVINQIKKSICQRQVLEFLYLTPGQEPVIRQVEPDHLLLKMNNWYLYGYCRLRKNFRVFKLSRIRDFKVLDTTFVRRLGIREAEAIDSPAWIDSPMVEVTLRFIPQLRGLAEEYFIGGDKQLEADGSLLVTINLTESNWMYGMILSYGNGVEVLGPERVRERLGEIIQQLDKKYLSAKNS